jgi:hypothetical protein
VRTLQDACASSCNKRPSAFALPIFRAIEKSLKMMTATLTAVPSVDTFVSDPMVGNPRRTRGLDRSLLERPAPVSNLVGNPRRLRKLAAAAFAA